MILLASPLQDTLARWRQGLRGVSHDLCIGNLDLLKEDIERIKPSILLLDYDLPKLECSKGVATLMKLSPETKIVILSNAISDETEWELFKSGVKGCCQKDVDPKLLKNIVNAVRHGELWIRRTLTCRLLDELGAVALEKNQIKQAASDLLANLTQREQEIATLVGNGENNKQIARRLAISERTVKAHLTEVFRKLNIEDRLKLALIVTGSLDSSGQARSNANLHFK
ncbi:MAG: response regulator transcription factor [Gallionellaceae bacterium]